MRAQGMQWAQRYTPAEIHARQREIHALAEIHAGPGEIHRPADMTGQDARMAKDDRGKGKHRQHDRGIPKGWLVVALGNDEQGMAPGRAIRWAAALVPETAPDVDAVRDTYPDALAVGNTVDGQPVTLRALTGAHEDDDEDEHDEHAPVVNPL